MMQERLKTHTIWHRNVSRCLLNHSAGVLLTTLPRISLYANIEKMHRIVHSMTVARILRTVCPGEKEH